MVCNLGLPWGADIQIVVAALVALALAVPLKADEPRILESAAKLAAETQLERPEPDRQRPAQPVARWLIASAVVGGIVAAMVLMGAESPGTLQRLRLAGSGPGVNFLTCTIFRVVA